MSENNLGRVLIVSRTVWDDSKGTSSTLTNLFQNYDASKIAHIYIETKTPNTKCSNTFFQISEFSLIRKLFLWKTKTGFVIKKEIQENDFASKTIAEKEDNLMSFVRKRRSFIFSFMREILWLFNGWKSKELKSFIDDFNPDVIWLDGSPLVLMNRINDFVVTYSKKPSVMYLMDDVYSYNKYGSFFDRIYKIFLRKLVKRVVDKCENIFVISPKMKKEYDAIFGIDSVFITKGIDFSKSIYKPYQVKNPIKLVYLGQVLYGRIYTLISIAEALKLINASETIIDLQIYTNNEISDDLRRKLLVHDSISLMKPVSYNEVQNVIANSDVVLFVESFEKKYKYIARLSFSTKLTDYLASGKAIFAIGPNDIAPIEYLEDEDAAIVVTDVNKINDKLEYLLENEVIERYSQKGFECAKRNHEIEVIDKKIKSILIGLSKINTEF